MRHNRTQAGSDEPRRLERGIVLELLSEDHDERWSRDELAASLRVDRSTLDAAVERLRAEGVLLLDGEHVLASPCARRIDALELIGV
jgi:Mn-dependent DtxR family transcriptional regulator